MVRTSLRLSPINPRVKKRWRMRYRYFTHYTATLQPEREKDIDKILEDIENELVGDKRSRKDGR